MATAAVGVINNVISSNTAVIVIGGIIAYSIYTAKKFGEDVENEFKKRFGGLLDTAQESTEHVATAGGEAVNAVSDVVTTFIQTSRQAARNVVDFLSTPVGQTPSYRAPAMTPAEELEALQSGYEQEAYKYYVEHITYNETGAPKFGSTEAVKAATYGNYKELNVKHTQSLQDRIAKYDKYMQNYTKGAKEKHHQDKYNDVKKLWGTDAAHRWQEISWANGEQAAALWLQAYKSDKDIIKANETSKNWGFAKDVYAGVNAYDS